MIVRWFPALISVAFLACWLAACGNEDTQITCITSFDCPGALICEDGLCVEDTGETPDDNGTVDLDTADEDTNPGFDSIDAPDVETLPDDEGVADAADNLTDGDVDMSGDSDTVVDVENDDAAPVDDGDILPTDVISDDDTVTDTTDTGTDVTPDVDTVVAGQTGSECSVPGDCSGSNVCAEVFTSQITNYCYLNCTAPNDTICNGTAWPQCTVVGSYALCLATATIVGSFTTTVDANPFVTGNNVALTINGTQNIQAACSAYQNTANDWVLQCSKILQTSPTKIQLDAVFFWPQAAHAAGTVAGAEGQVYETTYNSGGTEIDNWLRAFFLANDGSLTLTAAGTTTGTAVTGNLNFTGNAYDAQFAP